MRDRRCGVQKLLRTHAGRLHMPGVKDGGPDFPEKTTNGFTHDSLLLCFGLNKFFVPDLMLSGTYYYSQFSDKSNFFIPRIYRI